MMKGGYGALGSLSLGLLVLLGAWANPMATGSCEKPSQHQAVDCQTRSGLLVATPLTDIEDESDMAAPDLPRGSSRTLAGISEQPAGDVAGLEVHEQVLSADDAATTIAAALAGARSGPGPVGSAETGARMSRAERDAFRIAAQGCWTFDPESPAGRSTVTVGFDLDVEGKVAGPVELVWYDAPTPEAADQAFEAARRAILGCQSNVVALPLEEHDHRRRAELTFEARTWAIR